MPAQREPIEMIFHPSCNLQNAPMFESQPCTSKKCKDCSTKLCSNFGKKIECPPNCSRRCRNQRSKPLRLPKTVVYQSPIEGTGIKLGGNKVVQRGQVVMYYIGEVVSNKERSRRRQVYEEDGKPNNFFTTKSGHIIDPTVYGNRAKFANNSCSPNMVAKSWKLHNCPEGFRGIVYVAEEEIKPGTELTVSYGEGYDKIPCHCGSPVCSGIIGERLAPKALDKRAPGWQQDEVGEDEVEENERGEADEPYPPRRKKTQKRKPNRSRNAARGAQ